MAAKLTTEVLREINAKTIHAAGPRYTPGKDQNAPNLEIRPLLDAVDALALSEDYRQRIITLAQNLEETYSDSVRKIFARVQSTPETLIGLLRDQLLAEPAGDSSATLRRIQFVTNAVDRKLRKREEALWKEEALRKKESKLSSEPEKESEQKRAESIDYERHKLRKMMEVFERVKNFIRSPDFQLIDMNRMFILGGWGSGKTHFLCDVTRARDKAKLPTLFFLAHLLPDNVDPLHAICRAMNTRMSTDALLSKLNTMGRKAGARALIIIDGINEANHDVWRVGFAKIALQVKRFPNVGLIVSCRSPFEKIMFNETSRKLYAEAWHDGFGEIEFDAQSEFFRYYGIPSPQVPLLVSEFSRPLFLKMLCLSISGKTKTAKSMAINAYAGGQKGMTKIFEDLVIHIGKGIEKSFELKPKTCWNMFKGSAPRVGSPKPGFAMKMAAESREYVTRAECKIILAAWTGWTKDKKIEELLMRLMTDGLLKESLIFEGGQPHKTVQFPYQRFSDHLICRYLLDAHLRCESEQQVRRSFYRNKPLGKIFEVSEGGWHYQQPNFASAIMLEFPERVKNTFSKNKQELVFYLPKKARGVSPSVDVFLEGLSWRSPESFSKQTKHIVVILLENEGEYVKNQTLETLIGLGARPDHPLSANWLVNYLGNKTLPERDLFWSEYLRTLGSTSTAFRLFDWIERMAQKQLPYSEAVNAIRLCAMFLTTTRKPLRDRATKSLVLLGEKNPEALFNAVIEMLDFDDPYVRERMLAAAYGLAMRCWAFPSRAFSESIGCFARDVYDNMFAPRAPFSTTHILMRDYALGAIELALKVNPKCLGRRKVNRLIRPFPRTHAMIPSAARISERSCAAGDGALGMDFKNYTVGGMIKNRHNYDFKNDEYKGVLRQIKWRILNLGYSMNLFEDIDRAITNDNFSYGRSDSGERTARYGKKYSLIAFFEVCGMRADCDMLPYYEDEQRVSACDIDPSFPQAAPEWRPPIKPYFQRSAKNLGKWMCFGSRPRYEHLLNLPIIDEESGPWVMLDGFMQEKSPADDRQVLTFIHSVLVDSADIKKLRTRFSSVEYPGNNQIPRPHENYYAFAGEIPWAKTFGAYLRANSNPPHRHMVDIFDISRRKTVWKKRSNLSEIAEILEAARQPANDAGTVAVTKITTVPGIKAEIPVASFSWESYHSVENQAGSIDFPAPALCCALGLKNVGDMSDLVDQQGRPATSYRKFEKDNINGRFLYLRKDLLASYLRHTGQKVVWISWGERDLDSSKINQMRKQLEPILGSYRHVHKKFIVGRI